MVLGGSFDAKTFSLHTNANIVTVTYTYVSHTIFFKIIKKICKKNLDNFYSINGRMWWFCFFFGGQINDSISLYVTTMEHNKVNMHNKILYICTTTEKKTTGNLTNIVLSSMLLSNHIFK